MECSQTYLSYLVAWVLISDKYYYQNSKVSQKFAEIILHRTELISHYSVKSLH